jgi:hypothetical protein
VFNVIIVKRKPGCHRSPVVTGAPAVTGVPAVTGRELTAELQCSPVVTGTPVVTVTPGITGSRCHGLAKAAAFAGLVGGRMAYKKGRP